MAARMQDLLKRQRELHGSIPRLDRRAKAAEWQKQHDELMSINAELVVLRSPEFGGKR